MKKKIFSADYPLDGKRLHSSSVIAELDKMDLAKLRQAWTCLIGSPVPLVSAPILRLAIAFDLQGREGGGLSPAAIRRLETLASEGRLSVPVQPGMRLVREWKGALHVVTVDEGGGLNWKDRKWRSLSEVAREITGTRWSGPAFFGLVESARSA
jgi:hypothetical protein